MSNLVNPHKYYGDDLVLEMNTTGAAQTLTIPCQNVDSFNATINWGDGTTASTITTYNDADLAHEYADAGDHIIRISGTFPNIYFANTGDKLRLKRVLNLGNTGLTKLNTAFQGCTNLTSITSESSDTSLLTSTDRMLDLCSALTTFDTAALDVSAVTDMDWMFSGCNNAGFTSIDVSNWDTGACITMNGTFNECVNLVTLDVSGWNTSLVANMNWTFKGCDGLTDIRVDLWDIEAVTDLTHFMNTNLPGLTTARYDAVLIAWDLQNPVDSLTPDFGGSKYTAAVSDAATARASLESGDSWTITDGGTA